MNKNLMQKWVTGLYTILAVLSFLSFSHNAAAQLWTPKATFINGGSLSAYAFTINDTIYVGNTGNQGFYKYDYTTNTWTAKADVPAILFNQTVSAGFAVNGKGYLLGGIDQTGTCTSAVWEYTPASDSWVQKADFPGGKRAGARCFVIGNKVYVGAGYDTIDAPSFSIAGKNDFWQYDPATDSWIAKAPLPFDSSYLVAPFAFSINNKGYFVCGMKARVYGATSHDTDLNTTLEYDTLANTWTQEAAFPGAVRSGGVSFVLSNIAYCGTGMNDASSNPAGNCYNDFFAFDPLLNSWSALPASPFPIRTYAIAASVSTGKAYMGTGWKSPTTSVFYDDWWEFNPAAAAVPTYHATTVMSCFPNPCTKEMTIQIPDNSLAAYTYSIYTLAGQKISQHDLPANKHVSVGDIPAGNYLLVVSGNAEVFHQIFSISSNE